MEENQEVYAYKMFLSRIFNYQHVVILRRLNFMCRRFGTFCLFNQARLCKFSRIITPTFSTPVILHTCPPMKMEQTECSETLAYKIQRPGNCPKESIQLSEHGESLKSRINRHVSIVFAIIIKVSLHEY